MPQAECLWFLRSEENSVPERISPIQTGKTVAGHLRRGIRRDDGIVNQLLNFAVMERICLTGDEIPFMQLCKFFAGRIFQQHVEPVFSRRQLADIRG